MMRPYQISKAEELLELGEINESELTFPEFFHEKTVMKFRSLKEALEFGSDFLKKYLVPKYGFVNAIKFPITRTGPLGSASQALDDLLSGKEPDMNQESWLLIPDNRFKEVEE